MRKNVVKGVVTLAGTFVFAMAAFAGTPTQNRSARLLPVIGPSADAGADAVVEQPIVLAKSGALTKVQGQLQVAVQAWQQSPDVQGARMQSGLPAWLFSGDKVLVEIYYRQTSANRDSLRNASDSVRHTLQGLGAKSTRTLGNAAVVAWVPLASLAALAADPNIGRVMPARRVRHLTGSVTSEGVAASNADWWQTAGSFDGAGVKIGHIDSFDDSGTSAPNNPTIASLQASNDWPPNTQLTMYDFKDYSGAPGLCTTPGFGCEAVAHGDATMELLYDFAPAATFFAYDTYFTSDWYNAILDAANIDDGTTGTLGDILGPPKVNVISVSLGAPLDSIGDGTAIPGSIAEAAGFARANGVVIVNAAGNQNGGHWSGASNIATSGANKNYHRWSGSQTYNDVANGYCLPANFDLAFSLSWDDWQASGTQFAPTKDYALELYRQKTIGYVLEATSDFPQDGTPGETPQEYIDFTTTSSAKGPNCPAGTSEYFLRIKRNTAGASNYFQVFDEVGYDLLQYATSPASIGFPADSPNVISVAAIDQTTPTTIEDFSSRGPTLGPGGTAPVTYNPISTDPNPKPDLAQFDNVGTVAYGDVADGNGFYGTSAATPQAAAMVAQVVQHFGAPLDATDVDRIKDIVRSISATGANDLGTAGIDYTYGWGRFKFQKEASLEFEQQPGNTAAGQVITPNVSVGVRDDAGVLVRYGIFDEIAMAIGTNPPGDGILSQISAPISSAPVSGTSGGGVAAFNSASIDKVGAGYTLVASAGSLPSVTSNAFDITVGAPAKLVFSTQPPTSSNVGAVFAATVSVEDAAGNVVTTDTSTITVALTTPGGATLGGVTSVNAVAGVATFTDLTVNMMGTYTLTATDTALTAAQSDSFTIAKIDQVITFPTIAAQSYSSNGTFNVAASASSGLTVAFASTTPGVCTVSGTTVTLVAAGTCTITADQAGDNTYNAAAQVSQDIAINVADQSISFNSTAPTGATAGGTYVVAATATSGLAVVLSIDASAASICSISGSSSPATVTYTGVGNCVINANQPGDANFNPATQVQQGFAVGPGAAAALNFVVQPGDTSAGVAMSPAVQVSLVDAFGNVETANSGDHVSLLLATGTDPTFTGGSPIQLVNGVATFPAITLTKAATGYSLTASTDAGAFTATSATFAIGAGAVTGLIFNPDPPSDTVAGVAIPGTLSVSEIDQYANVVTSDNASSVSLVANGPGALNGSPVSATVVAGVASFNGNLVLQTAGSYSLTASTSASATANATSQAFSVSAGSGATLQFTPTPASIVQGQTLGSVSVTEYDNFGNVVLSDNTTPVTLTSNTCGSITLGSGVLTGGVVTFATTQRFYLVAQNVGLTAMATGNPAPAPAAATFDVNLDMTADIVFHDGFESCAP